jgi:UDP-N-acetylmuramate dehydrogenase
MGRHAGDGRRRHRRQRALRRPVDRGSGGVGAPARRGGTHHRRPGGDLGFAYDRSRLQQSGEVLLSAAFGLVEGCDPAALRGTARASLAQRKRTQPLDVPSAGCVFQNPDPARDAVPPGIPCSAGALVDRAGLKGRAVGGARVSPAHANFIVNDGSATAADIRALVRLCREAVRERFGVVLREEIRYLGEFEDGPSPADAGAV